jgi:hypothetical protein
MLDVVALLRGLPRYRLKRGHVGTIVQVYKSGRYEVEFADAHGQTLALATLSQNALLRLSYVGKVRGSRLVA